MAVSLASSPAHSVSFSSSRSAPAQASAAEIAAAIDRLAVVGSVLYVAAHPDDENTRLLAWLVGERGLRAGYLSMTRGDGGQNLIGSEQAELLGLIRTQELLAARRIDGAEQLFTRARDFGYSKSADETLRVWGKDEVLADVVLAIRRFRPDVIITRFTTSPPNHGHHTASALLAAEAFTAAADPKRFPEQLQGGLEPWRADRLLQNVSTWRMEPDADMSAYLHVDVGGYDPLSGRSWGEIAGVSRSQHKSQGFGSAGTRGPTLEYFEPLAGTSPRREAFEALDFSWSRFKGTAKLMSAIDAAREGFDVRAPSESLPALARVHAALRALPDSNPWKAAKLKDLEPIMASCAGLHLDVTAAEATIVPGGELPVRISALNRSPAKARLVGVTLPGGVRVKVGRSLPHHKPVELERALKLGRSAPISTPYWLEEPAVGGLYTVSDPTLIGFPEGEPPLEAAFDLDIAGVRVQLERPVRYTWVDPVRGELSRVVEVAPDVTLELERDVIMVPNGKPLAVPVTVVAGRAAVKGAVKLELPAGWRASPKQATFALASRGERRALTFQVTPPKGGGEPGRLRAVAVVNGRESSWKVRTVQHEHIPTQTVRQAAEAALVPLPLVIEGKNIAYIPGPGDSVAESLAAVGYDVTLLSDERLAHEDLSRFHAVVVGVRAYNANPGLGAHRDRLLLYVKEGGRLVVQYMTNSRVGPLTVEVGPYPLEIGRDRVTDETATMSAIDAKEPLLAGPNQIGAADFEGWVQERGLYFAHTWDRRYRPVFRMHDEGEAPLEGALLVADYGKGKFVYTGVAFFRQLPAGVPGAYRLMANLLAQ